MYKKDEESRKELSEKEKKDKQDAFQCISIFGKLYNIIVYIHSSAACIRLFMSYIERRILLDNYM